MRKGHAFSPVAKLKALMVWGGENWFTNKTLERKSWDGMRAEWTIVWAWGRPCI